MRALVTGATGFLGNNLARQLVQQGYAVRALVREGSDTGILRPLEVETVTGDLLDTGSLEAALEGCEVLFHAAAVYTFWAPDPEAVHRINVTGTENILAAAMRKGLSRVVYTSTESTVGTRGGLGTEELWRNEEELYGDYKVSKLRAERAALRLHREGCPLVVVNPTMPVGPGDVKPTPTGRIIVDFLERRMPACVKTGMNVVDVRDVARGHILALERGREGERYLLGGRNMTLRGILETLGVLTGLSPPTLDIPHWAAVAAARVDELVSGRILGRPPRIPLAAARTARHVRHFDCSKAVRELGLPQSPVETALADAVEWFRANGYIRRGAASTEELC